MRTIADLMREELKKTGIALGSNPGGTFTDTGTNLKHYIKFYDNPDQAHSEVLSAKIHEHLGVPTLNPEYVNVDGKHGVKTDWIDDLTNVEPMTPLNDRQRLQIAKAFHGAILTKNWDLAGQDFDNMAIHPVTKDVHLLDTGGSFNFRAMGGHKVYDDQIAEHDTLLDPQLNPRSHALLVSTLRTNSEANAATRVPHWMAAAHKPLGEDDHQHIKSLFMNSNVSNAKELHRAFVLRAARLHNKYGV